MHLASLVIASSMDAASVGASDGGAGPARSAAAHVGNGLGDGADAATVVWWEADGAGAVASAPSVPGGFVRVLRDSFVVGQGPPEGLEVSLEAWEQWLSATPPGVQAGGDAWAATVCRRMRRGDLPRGGRSPEGTPATEARLLANALALSALHGRLAEHFAEEVAAARFEACRELAYGAGHEINNPLANIATRAQTLLVGEHDPERRRRLSTIVDQAFRARDLIGGLMLLARPPKPRPSPADADDLVDRVLERVSASATPRRVKLEHRRASRAAPLWVDAAQVEEALRAVVVNAVEAVRDGGSVTVEVHAPQAGPAAQARTSVVVSDDGIGMDASTLRRAFDPFFSGREAGRGAGLGLSKARRFLDVNGGRIALESRPGVGTRVEICLPAAAANATPEFPASSAATA